MGGFRSGGFGFLLFRRSRIFTPETLRRETFDSRRHRMGLQAIAESFLESGKLGSIRGTAGTSVIARHVGDCLDRASLEIDRVEADSVEAWELAQSIGYSLAMG